ncbi:MAG: ATP synthase F0 subunit C [Phycisphaerae bacterium]|nr:ATP synthase F0 subunit C [Phycisphaerae bacterium]
MLTSSVLAAAESAIPPVAIVGLMVGCSIIILAAGFAIAWIGSRAVESIARQPEAGPRIFTTMIIAGALVEGVTFFALLIAFLALYWMKY